MALSKTKRAELITWLEQMEEYAKTLPKYQGYLVKDLKQHQYYQGLDDKALQARVQVVTNAIWFGEQRLENDILNINSQKVGYNAIPGEEIEYE